VVTAEFQNLRHIKKKYKSFTLAIKYSRKPWKFFCSKYDDYECSPKIICKAHQEHRFDMDYMYSVIANVCTVLEIDAFQKRVIILLLEYNYIRKHYYFSTS
jgi:hypothetical protein